MHRRPILWARIGAMLCMVAALGLGLQSASQTLEDFQHRAHGDVATSDGGWIIADCQGDEANCTVSGHGGDESGHGHHHHTADNLSAALTLWSPEIAFAAGKASLGLSIATQHPDDADVGRPGRVPRVSTRLI